ncbi:MAG: hypothetical protein JST17_00085 [Bacteroidetes bacterium]|nr:hypothetical protein [Bacteroidota bacterium]MBS1932213.1 hypothetical protein [Bacteroidota bacterium]
MLIATWGFYIHDKVQAGSEVKHPILTDSVMFKKAVSAAVEDTLKKVFAATRKDTINQSTGVFPLNDPITLEFVNPEKNPKSKAARTSLNFVASGITLIALKTYTGNKPEVTTIAKDSKKLVLSFILQNKILPSSLYTIYVVVLNPDNRVLRSGNSNNDYFDAGKEGIRFFTKKIQFKYVHKTRKPVTSILSPAALSPGTYTVKIYHLGEIIGKDTLELQ